MDDAQRRLEKQSLTNVRALVEKVERENSLRPSIVGKELLIAFAATLAMLAFLGVFRPFTKGDGAAEPKPTVSYQRADPITDFASEVRRRILAAGRPEVLRGLSGTVEVVVMVRPDGSFTEARVVSGGKPGEVDAALVEMVRKAAPFPPLPRELLRGRELVPLRLQIPLAGP